MSEWYERQRQRDVEARELSQSLLGPEAKIFADAMSVIASCLDAVFATDRLDDLVVKRKISVAHYAFNLLCSSWDEALAGRYQTATDHFRSIDEAPDFLTALDVDPSLADQMGDRRSIKVERARRAVQAALKRADPGRANERQDARTAYAKSLEPLSHISIEALGQYLPVLERDGQTLAVVRPGGAVSRSTLRPVAIHLALSALSLLLAVTNAFYDVTGIQHSDWKAVAEKSGDLVNALGNELAAMREHSTAPVSAVYFAATEEVIG